MKITDTATITGRGFALFTDELWTEPKWHQMSKFKTLRLMREGKEVRIEVLSVEAALKSNREEFITFLVPLKTNEEKIRMSKGSEFYLE